MTICALAVKAQFAKNESQFIVRYYPIQATFRWSVIPPSLHPSLPSIGFTHSASNVKFCTSGSSPLTHHPPIPRYTYHIALLAGTADGKISARTNALTSARKWVRLFSRLERAPVNDLLRGQRGAARVGG